MDGAFPSSKGESGGFVGDATRKGFRGTAENAKTKICMRWKNGHCRFGERCNFAHGDEELKKSALGRDLPGQGGGRGRGGFDYNAGYADGYGTQGGRGGGGYGQEYYGGGGGYGGGYQAGAGRGGGPLAGGYGRGGSPGMDGGLGPRGGGNGDKGWAGQAYPVQGPDGWVQYRAPETGEPYYHNINTNVTTWDKPAGFA